MPAYEVSLILRAIEKAQLSATLKRQIEVLVEAGGIVRKVQNLGHRRLPFVLKRMGDVHYDGHYFLVDYDSPIHALRSVHSTMRIDRNVLRMNVCRRDEEWLRPCQSGVECPFGEVRNPNYEKMVGRLKGFRRY